ncbi:MAG: hypothetical protein M3P08_20760 [Thermoproteota archaeon]|nr:hypothetical protein [Thermoproteota archaeon]
MTIVRVSIKDVKKRRPTFECFNILHNRVLPQNKENAINDSPLLRE